MILLPLTILQIVGAGGGLTINLEKQILLPETMMQIASAAAHSGALITFKVGKTILLPDTMLKVAATGRGRVVFDVS